MGSPAPCGQEASAAMWEEGGEAQAPRPRRPVVTGKAASADPPPPRTQRAPVPLSGVPTAQADDSAIL